ncbi:MAG: hypothetical protein ABJ171_11495 [Halieaceae bacterium]
MPLLQFPRRLLPLLLLPVFTTFAAAQDYYWVDSEGNKHSGNMEFPDDHDEDDGRTRDSTSRDDSYRHSNSQSDHCDAQWEAYERAASCFARCRTPTGNIAGCGHCRQMSQPNC